MSAATYSRVVGSRMVVKSSIRVGSLQLVSKSNSERNAIIDAADSMRTRVSTALIRTVEVVKDGISLKTLEDKLQQVDLNGVLQVLDLDKRFQAAAKGAGLQPNETSFLEAIKDTWEAGARAELDSLNMVAVHKGQGNPCHKPGGTSEGGQFCETGGSSGGGVPEKLYSTKPSLLKTNLWLEHPVHGVIFTDRDVLHMDWMGELRLPQIGKPFDQIPRGFVRISTGDRLIRISSYAGDPPPEVAKLSRSAIPKNTREVYTEIVHIQKSEVSKASNTIGLALAFDLLNPETIVWLSSYVMALIQQVSDETRRAIADVVMNAFQYGGHPYEQARTIRNMIGLTQQQSQAVANFRRMLENEPLAALTRDLRDRRFDSTLQNIGRLKGQLTKEQIDKMADAYYRKYLKYRSEMIARTETIRAARQGQEETWRQAIAQGLLPQGMKRKWIVTADDRLCPSCRSIPKLNPEGRGMDEQFMSDIGTVDGPPLHPHCRCAIVRKVDWGVSKAEEVQKDNPCHKPAGSSTGGQFCETGGGGGWMPGGVKGDIMDPANWRSDGHYTGDVNAATYDPSITRSEVAIKMGREHVEAIFQNDAKLSGMVAKSRALDAKVAANEARADRIGNQLNKYWDRWGKTTSYEQREKMGAEHAKLNDKLVVLMKKNSDIWNESRNLKYEISQRVAAKITEGMPAFRPLGVTNQHPDGAALLPYLRDYERMTGGSPSGGIGNVRFAAPAEGLDARWQRGYFNPAENTVYIGKNPSREVFFHEMGHWHEENVPGGNLAAVSFLQRRAGNAEQKSLAEWTGNAHYHSDEVARKDKFMEAYTGKIYPGAKATEITSMGFQYLSSDAASFFRMDREHFNFTVGMIRAGGMGGFPWAKK